jgi:hypothetical protein
MGEGVILKLVIEIYDDFILRSGDSAHSDSINY